MRHLVMGATGFIGRHLVRLLRSRGEHVSCLVRASSDVRELELLGAELLVGDMTQPSTLAEPVRQADVVHHLAGLLKVPWKDEFVTVNVDGTTNIARACADCESPPVLIVVSSLAAGGPSVPLARRTVPVARREDDGAEPISRYGRMKLASERAARSFADTVPMTIFRPPLVFGEGDKAGFELFRMAARGVQLLPASKAQRLALVHATDLAQAMFHAATTGERVDPMAGPGSGVYYVAYPQFLTMRALGAVIAGALQRKPPRSLSVPRSLLWGAAALGEMVGRWRDRPVLFSLDKAREATAGSWICDSDKARRDLDWEPAPLVDRIQETADWYRADGWLAS